MGKCPRCGKSVYFAERALGPGGDWHKACMRCNSCGKGVDSTTCCEHEGDVWCKSCHAKLFGPHGYGFAGGASIMHTQGSASPPQKTTSGSKCGSCSASVASGTKFCPQCGKNVTQKPPEGCPSCNAVRVSPTAKFCADCGHSF